MRQFFKDFSTFIRKGNIIDLAIGIIIGSAFNTIVKSLVNDIIMPLIGLIGGKNVANAKLVLVPAVTDDTGAVINQAVTLNYGAFLQSIIDFLIIALSIFVAIKVATRIRKTINKKEKEKILENKITSTDKLLIEIRDLLKNKEE